MMEGCKGNPLASKFPCLLWTRGVSQEEVAGVLFEEGGEKLTEVRGDELESGTFA